MVGGWTISGNSKAEHIDDAKRQRLRHTPLNYKDVAFRSRSYKMEKPERFYRPTRLYLRSSVAAVRSSSAPHIAGSGATRKNVPLTGLPVLPLKRWSRRRMWLPRRVKNTGQRCAHCDPVPIRWPATGLNGERACGASLEPRGGEPKKSPLQNHATAWERKPRAPEYASNDAKSSQSISAYWAGLKDTGHLRSYRRAERAIALS
jgi:hypothetical protein